MKAILVCVVWSLVPVAALAQGASFSGFFRSITEALSGPAKPAPQTSTSTLGIRGMDDGATVAAAPEAPVGDTRLLESWAVGRTEAESAAARRGLVVRVVELNSAEAVKSPVIGAAPAGTP